MPDDGDLPEPYSPADCDLRGYGFMPLFGHRLFGSDFYTRASDAEFRAAMRLWWAAWQQCPAGSLPNDDAALCMMADLGRDLTTWREIRAMALHGFVLCRGGRLYHPMICSEAVDAYARRRRDRERKARLRAGSAGSAQSVADAMDAGHGAGSPHPVPRDSPRISGRTGHDRTGHDLSEAKASAALVAAAPADAPPPDARTDLWRGGLDRLRRLTGKPAGSARALLGRFVKRAGDDCAVVAAVLFEAEQARPVEPVAWIEAAIGQRVGVRSSAAPRLPSNRDWMRDAMSPPPGAAPRIQIDADAEEVFP